MGHLRVIRPTNIQSARVARFLTAEANCHVRAKAPNHLSGAAPPKRLELKAKTEDHLRCAEQLTVVRMAQRFASRTQTGSAPGNHQLADQTLPSTPSLLVLPSGIRTLIAILILAVLIPNLLGAMFWLGVINMPWSRPVTLPPDKGSVPAVQPGILPPVLTAPPRLEAAAGENVIFPVALDGTDGVPARSIIAISGLPQGTTLSSGRPYGETEWNLKPDEIGDLRLVLPHTASGESKLTIKLIAPDDAVIADTETVLNVSSDPKGSLERVAETGSGDAVLALGANQEPNLMNVGGVKALGATRAEERLANVEAARETPRDPVPSPRGPAADDVHANWIKPLAFVNLRKGPSPSAPVISVVAKGAKLRVIGRKDRWVQVTNPASSEKGWIYTGHVATVTKARPKRAVHSEAQ
jgi:Bacterial SH3 domain